MFGLLLRNSADWNKAEFMTCLVQDNTIYSGIIVRIFVMAQILYIVSQQIHIEKSLLHNLVQTSFWEPSVHCSFVYI